METINDRFEIIVNSRFDGNKAAFAKAIGVSPAMLSNYLGHVRRSKPSVDMVVKVIDALQVDPYWLLTGKKAPAGVVNGNDVKYNASGNNNNNTTNNYHYNSNMPAPCDDKNNPVPATANASVEHDELIRLRQQVTAYERLSAEKERFIKSQSFTIDLLQKRVGELEEIIKSYSNKDKR